VSNEVKTKALTDNSPPQPSSLGPELVIIVSMAETSESPCRDRDQWPVRVYRLGEEPSDDLSSSTSPDERLAMMWELAERGWRLAGREIPEYRRSRMPGRVLRNSR
jgi:hypothetical protein